MAQIDSEIIKVLDNCLNIDIDHGCFAISYGIVFDATHLRKLFVNADQQLYPDIDVDKKYVDKFNAEVRKEYHDDYVDCVLDGIHPNVNGHRVDQYEGVVIQSKNSNVKSIIELYNLMKILKTFGRIPEDAYIGNIRWGDD